MAAIRALGRQLFFVCYGFEFLFFMKTILVAARRNLGKLSFRTGVMTLLLCIPFYILSFAQLAFVTSAVAKGVLWFILFGLAKCFQYAGLTILGVEGVKRLKAWWKQKKG